jgi:hypothetical protein
MSEQKTILDHWQHVNQPSMGSFNHAVDVANANYRRAEAAERLLSEAQEASAAYQRLAHEHEQASIVAALRAQATDAKITRLSAQVQAVEQEMRKALTLAKSAPCDVSVRYVRKWADTLAALIPPTEK